MAYRVLINRLENVIVNLKGDHQLINTSLALCATEVASSLGFQVGNESIYRGLSQVNGQVDLKQREKTRPSILDGAHTSRRDPCLEQIFSEHIIRKKEKY
jgi:folylpolyglutamate synthase/dihydropteroate synthase